MDPLSIFAAVLTIVGAVTTSLKAVKTFQHAPREYDELAEEHKQIRMVANHINTLTEYREFPDVDISVCLSRTRTKLGDAQAVIEERLAQRARKGVFSLRRNILLHRRSHIVQLTRDLNCIRHDLTATLDILNLSSVVQVHDHLQNLLANSHAPIQRLRMERHTPEVSSWTSTRLTERESSQLEDKQLVRIVGEVVWGIEQDRNDPPSSRLESGGLAWGAAQQLDELDSTSPNSPGGANDNQRAAAQQPKIVIPELEEHRPQNDLAEDMEALTVCIGAASEFSQDLSDSIADQYFYTPCSSMLDNQFELSSSFFPEQYVTDGPFNERIAVLVMSELEYIGEQRLDMYYLLFAETPRCWKRVAVSATSLIGSEEAVMSAVSTANSPDAAWKILPGVVQPLLEGVLSSVDLADTVTKVSICLKLQASAQLGFDPTTVIVEEDIEEARACESYSYLKDIDDMGCAQYLESEIVVYHRMSSSSYLVQAESQICIEWKAPFGGTAGPRNHSFQTWINNLRLLRHLEGCEGVTKFVGVVVDDSRTHIKSYLQEYVGLGIKHTFEKVQAKGKTLSWTTRENWAKQIINAVAQVHRRGVVIQSDSLSLWSIGVNDQKNVFLTSLGLGAKQDHYGLMAPEFRQSADSAVMHHEETFRSDIFRLGLTLYQLAEHVHTYYKIHCERAGCTTIPIHRCIAEHCNPVNLPRCSPEVPSYFNDIIAACRCADPRKRLPAASLLKLFPPRTASELDSGEDDSLLRDIITPSDPCYFSITCNGCGSLTTDLHYHCNACHCANFDICAKCLSDGISCDDDTHTLTRRVLKDRKIVNDSESA
ncbi:MAG: hypothetical protein M1836_006779 [Candelina mexicana]|nr:MAG: hypothetical protein M1836_006779 [Candelina mexicana]